MEGSPRSTKPNVKICELKPFMKRVNLDSIVVLEKGPPSETADGHLVSTTLVADESGSIYLSLWDDYISVICPGDILQLKSGYCALFNDQLTAYVGQHGSLKRTGHFFAKFKETPNMSTIAWKKDPITKAFVPADPKVFSSSKKELS